MLTGLEQRNQAVRERRSYAVLGKTTVSYAGNLDGLIRDLAAWKRDGWRVVLLAGSRTRAERLAGNLRDYELPAVFAMRAEEGQPEREVLPGQILVTVGNIHKSFEYPQIRFAVISEGELFGRERKKKKHRHASGGQGIRSYDELSKGDYVVHENHGLGIYRGIEKVEVDHVLKDYIKLEYKGSNLYILATQLDRLQKYASQDADRTPEAEPPGRRSWKKTKTRVKNRAVRTSRRTWCGSTPPAGTAAGSSTARIPSGRRSSRNSSPTRRPRTSCWPSRTPRRTWRAGRSWTG